MGRGRVVGGLDNGRKGDWDWGFDIFGERCAALGRTLGLRGWAGDARLAWTT